MLASREKGNRLHGNASVQKKPRTNAYQTSPKEMNAEQISQNNGPRSPAGRPAAVSKGLSWSLLGPEY